MATKTQNTPVITHLSEVTRVELVEEDAVVVLATGVTASTGMLPVLPDTSVTGGDVPPLLAVLRVTGRLQYRSSIHLAIASKVIIAERTQAARAREGGKMTFWWSCTIGEEGGCKNSGTIEQ